MTLNAKMIGSFKVLLFATKCTELEGYSIESYNEGYNHKVC